MQAVTGGLIMLSGAVLLAGGLIADMLRYGVLVADSSHPQDNKNWRYFELVYPPTNVHYTMIAGVVLLVIGLVIAAIGLRKTSSQL